MTQVGLARTFLDGVGDLGTRERRLAWEFVDKLMTEHIRRGIRLERIRNTRAANLWSARVSRDLRAVIYKEGASHLLLHVGHHDAAYAWAERRSLVLDERNNRVHVVETLEVERKVEREVERTPPLFAGHEDDYLLSIGVLASWLPAVRAIRETDQLLELCEELPAEIAEALLDVAEGRVVAPPRPEPRPTVLHADAERRYWIIPGQDELHEALAGSLDDWILFLHPDQRRIVEGVFRGPVQVVGAAGTGKTIVALHRARELASRGARVLLATFTRALARNLSHALKQLCTSQQRSAVEISTIHRQALEFASARRPRLTPLSADELAQLIREQLSERELAIEPQLVVSEWQGVIAPLGLLDWDGYRDAPRVGRGRALTIDERREVWEIVADARKDAWKQGKLDWAGICGVAARSLHEGKVESEFDAVLVDEVQDLGAAELRLVHALARSTPEHAMLFGDVGQRIYAPRSTLADAGIDVRGRRFELRTNYRTTEAISRAAASVFGPAANRSARSLLRGPAPCFEAADTLEDEVLEGLAQIEHWIASGLGANEIAVLARVDARLDGLRRALPERGLSSCELVETREEAVRLGTIHAAKGLEFKAVLVIGCEEGTLPLLRVVDARSDPLDREVQLERERNLLYVAMTRARDELTLTWVGELNRWLSPVKAES